VRVLLVVSDPCCSWEVHDVQSQLLATGAFAAVDIFDANLATPGLSTLQA